MPQRPLLDRSHHLPCLLIARRIILAHRTEAKSKRQQSLGQDFSNLWTTYRLGLSAAAECRTACHDPGSDMASSRPLDVPMRAEKKGASSAHMNVKSGNNVVRSNTNSGVAAATRRPAPPAPVREHPTLMELCIRSVSQPYTALSPRGSTQSSCFLFQSVLLQCLNKDQHPPR